MKKGAALLALIACCCLHGTARAQDAPASDRITLDVSATVPERCGIAPQGPASTTAADLDSATSLDFDFRVDCNTRFRIGVSSLNGALRLEGATASAADGFATDKTYLVGLKVFTDGATMTPDACSSAQLVAAGPCSFFGAAAGEGLSSDQRTAINRRGVLNVKWGATERSGGPRRAAGTYSDTLTIVVGAQS